MGVPASSLVASIPASPMRVVAVLKTRDQADIVEAVLAFHLAAGVDLIVAVDHRSVDGTREILERYAASGRVLLLHEEGDGFSWTRDELARMAARELGADWVLHPDGDELWWPRGGSWPELVSLVPPRYGILRGAWRHFVPRPEEERHPLERLTVRISPYAERTAEEYPFHPGSKVAHRGDPEAVVGQGGHDLRGGPLRPLRGWFPFEILHFPLRSLEQGRRKYEQMAEALTASGRDVPPHVERARKAIAAGTWQELYRELVVDDGVLADGLAQGTLIEDARPRDALRLLAGVDELPPGARFPLPGQGLSRLTFSPPPLRDQAAFAHECEILYQREADVRLRRRIDRLEERLRLLERSASLGRELARRIRRRLGRGRR